MRHLSLVIFLGLLSSCIVNSESPIESLSNEANLIQTGDIIISNSGTDSIILLNSEGSFKANLTDVSDPTLVKGGLAFDPLTKHVLFTYDSSTAALDAVRSISLFDGTVSTFLTNSNLTGTGMNGVARLTGGDLLVLEGTNTAEKFLSTGVRSGNPFLNTITTNVADIDALASGGFVTCSSGTSNTVRTYTAAGAVQPTVATSVAPAPSMGSAMAATSCEQDRLTGNIAVAYNGTNDGVRMYNSTLSTVIWTFQDGNNLANPGKLSIRPNGNVLVIDLTANHIVEIDGNGAFVGIINAPLSTPNSILVMP